MRKYANLALFLGILLAWVMPARATVYAKIKGRVVDAQTGKGVEGVRYKLYFMNIDESTLPPSYSLGGKTGKDGFFEKLLPVGKVCIGFYPKKYKRDPSISNIPTQMPEQCFYTHPGEEIHMVKKLEKGEVLEGRLIKEGGGLKGVLVILKEKEADTPGEVVYTDDSGRFRIEGLWGGEVELDIGFTRFSSYPNAAEIYCKYYISPGVNELNIDASWVGTTGVKVKVVDENGKPLDPDEYLIDVHIASSQLSGVLSEEGECDISPPFAKLTQYYPPGKYVFTLEVMQYNPWVLYKCPDKKEVEIEYGKIKEIRFVFSPEKCKPEELGKIKKKEELPVPEECKNLFKYLLEKNKKGKLKHMRSENCPHPLYDFTAEKYADIMKTACVHIYNGCPKWDSSEREKCVRKYAKTGIKALMDGWKLIIDCNMGCDKEYAGEANLDGIVLGRTGCENCELASVAIHELLHLGTATTKDTVRCPPNEQNEEFVEACEYLCDEDEGICYVGSLPNPKECRCGNECDDKDGGGGGGGAGKGGDGSSSVGNDNPDETKGIINTLLASVLKFSKIADTTLWKKGYWSEGGDLLNFFKMEAALVESDQSPLNMQPPAPVWILPTGSLYGEEGDLALKYSLDEYIKNGGTALVFAQQHGSDFSILPTPSDLPLYAYGWREDQSCSWARGIEKVRNFPKI